MILSACCSTDQTGPYLEPCFFLVPQRFQSHSDMARKIYRFCPKALLEMQANIPPVRLKIESPTYYSYETHEVIFVFVAQKFFVRFCYFMKSLR